jgi:hypothetical protein
MVSVSVDQTRFAENVDVVALNHQVTLAAGAAEVADVLGRWRRRCLVHGADGERRSTPVKLIFAASNIKSTRPVGPWRFLRTYTSVRFG